MERQVALIRRAEPILIHGIAAALWCSAFVGCDQFATVGIRQPGSSDAGAPPPSGGGAGEAPADDAATASDSGSASDAGPANDASAECDDVEVAGCNPVTNEGCSATLMMQCAVDLLVPLGGYCTFYSGPAPIIGSACLNTGVTESCPPTSACVLEQCRKICLCDGDCEAGQCCADPLEGTGFNVCGDC